DLRTVTGGGSSFAAGAWRSAPAASAVASVRVDGARPLRRGSASAVLERSDFGQASSNVARGPSVVSDPDGTTGGGRASGADGSVVRAWARSRSLCEDDENSRLRRCLA